MKTMLADENIEIVYLALFFLLLTSFPFKIFKKLFDNFIFCLNKSIHTEEEMGKVTYV